MPEELGITEHDLRKTSFQYSSVKDAGGHGFLD
jgi:hypothetical protein